LDQRLDEVKDLGEADDGTKFIARFVKNRNATEEECPSLVWRFRKPGADGRIGISWKRLSTNEVFRQCIEDGLSSATDIAAEMDITKGMVSEMASRTVTEGRLTKDGWASALVQNA
jgi:hypothetical protein